jgi:hypothetical protein
MWKKPVKLIILIGLLGVVSSIIDTKGSTEAAYLIITYYLTFDLWGRISRFLDSKTTSPKI